MRIYNYLFYKSYLLAKRSRNFDDIPVLGGISFVALCVMLNLFSVFLFIEGLGVSTGVEFDKKYKYLFSLLLVLLLLFYYSYNERYKKIVESFEQNKKQIQLHPIVVIILYYGISVLLFFLSATYKNHDWIFAQ